MNDEKASVDKTLLVDVFQTGLALLQTAGKPDKSRLHHSRGRRLFSQ
jgi:hypothetical protein